MLRVSRLIFFMFSLCMAPIVYALTEFELQSLDRFSFLPTYPSIEIKQYEFDMNLKQDPKKSLKPVSIKETRAKLREMLALHLNPSTQIGFDSFKATPIDSMLLDWPGPTKPKACKSRSQKGYGVGVRMKID